MRNCIAWLMTILFALTFIPACGGGGGGGGGSTRTVAINLDEFNDGDLATYTKEIWTFSVPADTEMFISVELYGARLDQGAWSDTTLNAPIVTLVDNSVIGGTELLQHNIDANSWIFGYRDTEIPLYLLQNSDPVSSKPYSIEVTRKDPAATGARYKIRVNDVSSEINTEFGTTILESELPGGNSNDDETASEAITLEAGKTGAIVFGHYDVASPDYYKLDITPVTDDLDPLLNFPVTISCFEIISSRNGIGQFQTDYFDPEIVLHREIDPVDPTVELQTNLVDDTYFLDPRICLKVSTSTTDTYHIEINKTLGASEQDADYLLKYSEERINELKILFADELTGPDNTEDGNDDHSTADAIAYADFVEGEISSESDEDWFFFTAAQGDMIRIRQFDNDLADDSDGTITLELYDPDLDPDSLLPVIVPFNGPADASGRLAALFPDMTTTSLLVKKPGDYRIKVSDDPDTLDDGNRDVGLIPKVYSFYLELVKSSQIESATASPGGNDNSVSADPIDSGRASGTISVQSDIDYFTITDIELDTLGITDGDLVAVHVYAKKDFYWKAYDESGYGSTLEPKISVLDSGLNLITTSRYIDNTTDDTASEGINEPFPTLSAVFVANPSTEAKYYFKIENSSNYDNSEPDIAIPSYMIELVNLGQ